MDLTLDAEQEAIRSAIRGVLAEQMSSARVRAVIAGTAGVDEGLWRTAGELGWFGLGVAEQDGGSGYGLPEEMLLFVELGRAVAPGPWLGTVLAAGAAHVGRAEVLAGERRVAVVDDPRDTLGIGSRAGGIAHAVPDAGAAHALLVLGSRMARLVALGDGVEVDARPSMDPTRSLATLRLHEVPATPVESDVGVLRRAATVLAAAEAVGVAERTVEMSVEYGKVRQQFGKPIGSFQAIKHRCADMAVRAEVARSAVIYAAVAVRDGEGDAEFLVRAAKLLASTAAVSNATDNIQNHGGMGYTWEADAHLYLKRARLLEQTFGTGAAHLDAIAAPWRAT